MKQTTPLAITISRQLGSGGAYIGQQIAKKLDIYYADREILSKAAKQLGINPSTLYRKMKALKIDFQKEDISRQRRKAVKKAARDSEN